MAESERVRVSLANDFAVVVAGLCALLAPYADAVQTLDWVDIRDDPDTAAPSVDVLLFDTFGRAELGLADVRRLAASANVGRVAVYASRSSPALAAQVLAEGASGFLTKHLSGEELARAVVAIHGGEQVIMLDDPSTSTHAVNDWPGRSVGLTPREGEVLALVATGRRNQEIAESLYVSLDTVKTHVKVVYRKLGVRNRAEAVGLATKDLSFTTISTWHAS